MIFNKERLNENKYECTVRKINCRRSTFITTNIYGYNEVKSVLFILFSKPRWKDYFKFKNQHKFWFRCKMEMLLFCCPYGISMRFGIRCNLFFFFFDERETRSRYHLGVHRVNPCAYAIVRRPHIGEVTRTRQARCDELDLEVKLLAFTGKGFWTWDIQHGSPNPEPLATNE